MQRVVALLGEQLVGAHHDHRVVVLDRDLEVAEAVLLEQRASHSADSTSASGVALPYFCSSRGSSDPALTPMRIDTPASAAARAISPTWSSNCLDVARVDADGGAAGVDRGEHVLRLEVDVGDHRDLRLPGDRRQRVGVVLARHATRTISQPVAVSSAICCSVALMSVVGVVVIDCTETGASPPTSTLPTWIWRVWSPRGQDRRGQCRHAEGDGHVLDCPILGQPERRDGLTMSA